MIQKARVEFCNCSLAPCFFSVSHCICFTLISRGDNHAVGKEQRIHQNQKVVDVAHPGEANVSKAELKQQLATLHEVKDLNSIFVFKSRTAFGGGKSTGFGLIYDSVESAKKYEPQYRLIRAKAGDAAKGGKK